MQYTLFWAHMTILSSQKQIRYQLSQNRKKNFHTKGIDAPFDPKFLEIGGFLALAFCTQKNVVRTSINYHVRRHMNATVARTDSHVLHRKHCRAVSIWLHFAKAKSQTTNKTQKKLANLCQAWRAVRCQKRGPTWPVELTAARSCCWSPVSKRDMHCKYELASSIRVILV